MSYLNRGWTYTDRIGRPDAGCRALDFYCNRYPHSSREQWAARFAAGYIRLGNRVLAPGSRLATNDRLEYRRPPWREPDAPAGFAILHEDDDLVAVGKPSGLPVLPGGDFLDNTLLFKVRRRYADAPAPVHRLGRGTSGLVLFARTMRSRRFLSAAFRHGRLHKFYRARVQGLPSEDRFTIAVPIGRRPYPPLGSLYMADDGGKPSLSHCRVLQRDATAGHSLVEVEIPTGRPHQIRIHLAAAGHPLVGDPLYSTGGRPRPLGDGPPSLPGDLGYALHALSLFCDHPAGHRLELYCPPPPLLRYVQDSALDRARGLAPITKAHAERPQRGEDLNSTL